MLQFVIIKSNLVSERPNVLPIQILRYRSFYVLFCSKLKTSIAHINSILFKIFTDIMYNYLKICACHHNPQVQPKKRWSCIYGSHWTTSNRQPIAASATASELLLSSFLYLRFFLLCTPPSVLSLRYGLASVRARSPCRRTCGLPIAVLINSRPLLRQSHYWKN